MVQGLGYLKLLVCRTLHVTFFHLAQPRQRETMPGHQIYINFLNEIWGFGIKRFSSFWRRDHSHTFVALEHSLKWSLHTPLVSSTRISTPPPWPIKIKLNNVAITIIPQQFSTSNIYGINGPWDIVPSTVPLWLPSAAHGFALETLVRPQTITEVSIENQSAVNVRLHSHLIFVST